MSKPQEAELARLRDDIEMAWTIIANAYGGNWSLASPDWKEAAERWRDKAWHRIAGCGAVEMPLKDSK